MADELPTWTEIDTALNLAAKGVTPPALHSFISKHIPHTNPAAEEFRKGLLAVLQEHAAAAPPTLPDASVEVYDKLVYGINEVATIPRHTVHGRQRAAARVKSYLDALLAGIMRAEKEKRVIVHPIDSSASIEIQLVTLPKDVIEKSFAQARGVAEVVDSRAAALMTVAELPSGRGWRG